MLADESPYIAMEAVTFLCTALKVAPKVQTRAIELYRLLEVKSRGLSFGKVRLACALRAARDPSPACNGGQGEVCKSAVCVELALRCVRRSTAQHHRGVPDAARHAQHMRRAHRSQVAVGAVGRHRQDLSVCVWANAAAAGRYRSGSVRARAGGAVWERALGPHGGAGGGRVQGMHACMHARTATRSLALSAPRLFRGVTTGVRRSGTASRCPPLSERTWTLTARCSLLWRSSWQLASKRWRRRVGLGVRSVAEASAFTAGSGGPAQAGAGGGLP